MKMDFNKKAFSNNATTYAQTCIMEKIGLKTMDESFQDLHWDESSEYDVYGDLSW